MSDQGLSQDEIPLADQVGIHDPYILRFHALPEDVAKEMAEAISAIRAMYDSGVPLYTKEMLADVSKQIATARDTRQKIRVKAINGETVELDIETGRVIWPTDQPNLEYILTAPEIEFRTYQAMISTKYNFHPPMAYSPLRIIHYVEWRDHVTKESLKRSPSNSWNDTQNNLFRIQQLWKDSAPCKKLESILEQTLPPEIETVAAFALGSISGRDQATQASLFQHALTLTVRDIVKRTNKRQRVNCYSQDPIYNAVDKSVLRESRISVLDSPRAFLEVNHSSVVISCAPDVPVKQIVADLARPAAMIWNSVGAKRIYPEMLRLDEDSPRVEQMIRDYYKAFEFPGDVDLFGNLTVYVRSVPKDQCEGQPDTIDDL